MIDLNFLPLNREGKPHIIDYSAAKFIADILDGRINIEHPELENRIANELHDSGTCNLAGEELTYIHDIIQGLPIYNLLKGQILKRFLNV